MTSGMIAIGAVIIVAIWEIITYNKLIRVRNNAREGFSTIEVYLKKRYDMIPNLVNCVKGYAAHESKTLKELVLARNQISKAVTPRERIVAETNLSSQLKNLFALAEAYPDLKANQNFLELQAEITAVEEDIANARKYYNATIKLNNNMIETFPNNIVAKIFKFEQYPMFAIYDEKEEENVKVKF